MIPEGQIKKSVKSSASVSQTESSANSSQISSSRNLINKTQKTNSAAGGQKHYSDFTKDLNDKKAEKAARRASKKS